MVDTFAHAESAASLRAHKPPTLTTTIGDSPIGATKAFAPGWKETASGLVSALSIDEKTWEICQWSITKTHFHINALTSTRKGKSQKPKSINGDCRSVLLSDIRQLQVGSDISESGFTENHIQIIIGGRTMASYVMGDVNSSIWILARDGFEREELVRSLKQGAWQAREDVTEKMKDTWMAKRNKVQERIAELYSSTEFQVITSVLIVANFVITTTEAQILPERGSRVERTFEELDLAFTILFTLELAFNMAGNLWLKFWRDSWNWFDFLVVSTSLVGLALESSSPITILRLLRPLRVFRLFRRAQALRQVLNALGHSIIPVMNAFAILLLVSVIYAVLAVSFFGEEYPTYFKNFFTALFTMFQVLTGDAWASEIARPILEAYPASAAFFVSYVMLCGMVLINVMVAILLEEFAKAGHMSAMQQVPMRDNFSFDILYELVRPLIHLNNEQQEAAYILKSWNKVETRGKGVLYVGEVRDAILAAAPLDMKRMKLSPPSIDVLTDNGRFCNEKGEIDFQNWSELMHYHATRFATGLSHGAFPPSSLLSPGTRQGGTAHDVFSSSGLGEVRSPGVQALVSPSDSRAGGSGWAALRGRRRSLVEDARTKKLEDKVDDLTALVRKMSAELLALSSAEEKTAAVLTEMSAAGSMRRRQARREGDGERGDRAGATGEGVGQGGGGRGKQREEQAAGEVGGRELPNGRRGEGGERAGAVVEGAGAEEGKVKLRMGALAGVWGGKGRGRSRGREGERRRSAKGSRTKSTDSEREAGTKVTGGGWKGRSERAEAGAWEGEGSEAEAGMVHRGREVGEPMRSRSAEGRWRHEVGAGEGGEGGGGVHRWDVDEEDFEERGAGRREWGITLEIQPAGGRASDNEREGKGGEGIGSVFERLSGVLSPPAPATSLSTRKGDGSGNKQGWVDGWM